MYLQSSLNHQGLLKGKKPGRGKGGKKEMLPNLSLKATNLSSSVLPVATYQFLATRGNANACGHHKVLSCGSGYSNTLLSGSCSKLHIQVAMVYILTVKCTSVVNHYYLCFMWLVFWSNYHTLHGLTTILYMV